MLEAVDILGVSVVSGPTNLVVEHLDERINKGEVTRVAFLNTNLANQAEIDIELKASLKENFLVLNDGLGIDFARFLLYGKKFDNNLNGTDFTSAFLSGSAINLRIFLLGAREDVVRKAAATIHDNWPRHTVVGLQHGYFNNIYDQYVKDLITELDPDLTLVAMGNPKQEHWIASHVPTCCPAAFGVGAWFDFVTETMPRAPLWVRRLRGEWMFRLICEPRRMARRYLLGNVVFLWRVVRAKLTVNILFVTGLGR